MIRAYSTLKKLRDGETVEIEGCQFREIPGDIIEGDYYIAERNTGPKLLTAKKIIHPEIAWFYIIPEEDEYCYDVWECVRVEIVS